jgi:hypothetical protein
MNQDPREEFGSVETTHYLWKFFSAQADLFEQAYKVSYKATEEHWGVVLPLAYSALDTCKSIAQLAQYGRMRDCFVLSRTAFETLVNVCFILAKGNTMAIRARQHAIQKSYRDLTRESKVNGNTWKLEYQGEVILSPEIQAALNEFTSKKGREITSWTPETTAEQIAVIDARFGKSVGSIFHLTLLAIYRHSSEIAHGTYFGALFSLGMTTPGGQPKTQEQLAQKQRQNLCMIMQMLGMSLAATLEVFDTENAITELVVKAKSLIEDLSKESWVSVLNKE